MLGEASKSKLADEFHEKVVLTLDQAEELKGQLAKDTKLLADCHAVDYLLFLVRILAHKSPAESGSAPPGLSSTWRTGITSADGRFVYRAAVLDFFWAKHKVHAMAMTGLIYV